MASHTNPPEYVLPNNAQESERLDFQHLMLTKTFGGLHRARLDSSKETLWVLDVGCGTGNWAIDFAKQYPQARVIGFDVQEKGNWATASSNCTFHVADLESPSTWSELGQFDYIHGRFIVIGVRDWPRLLQKCHEHLVPGGHLEIQEFCMPTKSLDEKDYGHSKFLTWGEDFIVMSAKVGLNTQIMDDMRELMSDAGFEGIGTEEFRMMTGPWMEDEEGKALGRMGQQNLSHGMHGFGETLWTKVSGWNMEDYERLVEKVVLEIRNDGLRTWLPIKVSCAQKRFEYKRRS